ncbi:MULTISPECIES: AMP-binding protein [unclassified Pseudomonas]|uniref:AMP-binding protein n=1 Tax=unclassified Pseudomonas TaxID=196821 RepID=UPI001C49B59E|nr:MULTISPECIES: AMP-binding protein [unclassified Pseudomonas]
MHPTSRRYPRNVAVIHGDARMTYQQLNQESDRLCGVLQQAGVNSSHTVPLIAQRTPELIIGILAIAKTGAAYIPVDIQPGAKFRLGAGPYDMATGLPRYSYEISAAAEGMRHQVTDKSHLMGPKGRHFWVYDITNESTMPVLITLTKNGTPFRPLA